MSNILTRAAAGIFILLACGGRASALNAALDINQYAHTAWKIRDGFLSGRVVAFAQTLDGYLWLGTELGLVRFDGIRPMAWSPPAGSALPDEFIYSLLAARDGTLWIGTRRGLAAWDGRSLRTYPKLEGSIVYSLVQDRSGVIWVGSHSTGAGLCSIRGESTECYGADGSLGEFVGSLYEDSHGAVWFAATSGVWRWTPQPRVAYRVPNTSLVGFQGFAELDTDTLLCATGGTIWRLVDGTVRRWLTTRISDRGSLRGLFRDRSGAIWVGTSENGLLHLHDGHMDTFGRRDGLSGDQVIRLFEDREGTIWVATNEGLDRFRPFAATTYSATQGLSGIMASVLPSADSSAWVSTTVGLFSVRDGQRAVSLNRAPASAASSLFEDRHGRQWIGSLTGLGYVDHGRFVGIDRVPPGAIDAIAEDAQGNVWLAHRSAGLFRVSPGGGVQQVGAPDLGQGVWRMAADPVQGLWLGRSSGIVVHLSDGKVHKSFTASDGLGKGFINDIRAAADGTIWVATDGGLNRIREGRVAILTKANGLPCDAIDSTIEDHDGFVWLYASCGLLRIPHAELSAWSSAVDRGAVIPTIRPLVLGIADGVRSFAVLSTWTPHLVVAPDGRLWFVTPEGVAVIDPRHLRLNELPPPVHIQQVTADGRPYAPMSPVRLPPRVRDLQIDYAALSLVAPENNRFRIRLEGRDHDWQDAGTRRQVFYTDLAPRTYRFHVIASNNSGVWNNTGAMIEFSIAPTYYQTTWFWALIGVMTLALAWGVHRIRFRIVETHEREMTALNERMMKAQEQERMRIAGELHDSVMQQMLSMTMMVGTAKRRIDDPSKAKATLDQIQEKLIQTGADIRQISHGLHPPMLQEAGLPAALRTYCEQFSAASNIPVLCDCDESAHDLSRGAALALFRIVQEALGNAAKHAQAKRISVRIARTNGMVTLTVSDDGVGFDTSRLSTSGGLGLVMMRERATQLNGTFHFESAAGRGATITVVIPFR